MSNFSKEQVEALKGVFSAIDKDGSGSISVTEFESALKDSGLDISREEVIAKVKEADKDGSGTIDFKEFLCQLEKGL